MILINKVVTIITIIMMNICSFHRKKTVEKKLIFADIWSEVNYQINNNNRFFSFRFWMSSHHHYKRFLPRGLFYTFSIFSLSNIFLSLFKFTHNKQNLSTGIKDNLSIWKYFNDSRIKKNMFIVYWLNIKTLYSIISGGQTKQNHGNEYHLLY